MVRAAPIRLTRKQKKALKIKSHIERKKKYEKKKREEIEPEDLIRTVDFTITFSCCAPDTAPWEVPEPLRLILDERGSKIKSLVVWKDMFLDSSYVRDYIESIADSKCRRALGESAYMCEDGYEIDVLDYYEE